MKTYNKIESIGEFIELYYFIMNNDILSLTINQKLNFIPTSLSISKIDNIIIISSKDGSIYLYDFQLNLIKLIPNVIINGIINSIEMINQSIIIIYFNFNQLNIFDISNEKSLESLPFKDITDYNILSNDGKLVISTKNLIILYQFELIKFNGLEMIKQFKFNDKIIQFKYLENYNQILLNYNNSSIIQLFDIDTNQLIKLNSFQSNRLSIFNRNKNNLELLTLKDKLIISKNTNVLIYQLNQYDKFDGKLFKFYQLDIIPQFWTNLLQFFIIIVSNSNIYIKNIDDFINLQTIPISNKILMIDSIDNEFILTIDEDNIISKYSLSNIDDIIEQISQNQSLEKSINFLENLDMNNSEYFLKLRDLKIQFGKQLFYKENYKQSIEIFIKFIASPFQIINLYSDLYIKGETNKEPSDDIDKQSLLFLTQFLIDIRRIFNKLLKSLDNKIPYLNNGVITIDLFTESGKYSIDDVRIKIDTTLFRIYSIINLGLIGSLVRLNNYCDSNTVIQILRNKQLYSELVDFYFQKSNHNKALDLLIDLKDDHNLIKYLQRLNNDNLQLILKYSTNLILKDQNNAIKIFIDSPFADNFKKITVLEFFIELDNDYLQMIYLEYIIKELNDKSLYFNNKLLDIYFKFWNESNRKSEEYYDKITRFLTTGSIDLKSNLSKYFTNPQTSQEFRLKLIILQRLSNHNQVLKILIDNLKDSKNAINYIKLLYEIEDNETASKNLIILIKLLLSHNDKSSILKILTQLSLNHKLSNIRLPITEILNELVTPRSSLISSFKIYELESIIIRIIRSQRKTANLLNLTQIISSLKQIKTEETLLSLKSYKNEIVNNYSKCDVCGLYLSNNSVLSRFPNGEIVHFGCAKTYNDHLKNTLNFPKLKSIKLKDL
ncbi:hypothetical protein WICMUC_004986 [Wickerhamomyces mucosus]|uniref:CNH domain-containing protein n=1 Tax=Wickerhamomyces mucosus TaxID=1378264 RepID=A0A9P8PD81_9ASCO|nr:hypothetical protein WICMUC_004986 [Wickerhamomyces mucosus]